MKFEQYRQEVKRTLPSLGSVTMDSVHMVLGMCSELYELAQAVDKQDTVNIAEELTDIAWYVCNYMNIRNIKTDSYIGYPIISTNYERDNSIKFLILYISELQDYDKKELAYNKKPSKEIEESRNDLCYLILVSLNHLYSCFEIDPEQAMQNNIDKLRKRFPNSFNEHEANNRNLNSERKELEK